MSSPREWRDWRIDHTYDLANAIPRYSLEIPPTLAHAQAASSARFSPSAATPGWIWRTARRWSYSRSFLADFIYLPKSLSFLRFSADDIW